MSRLPETELESSVDLIADAAIADRPFWRTSAWRRRTGRTSIGVWAATALAFGGSVIAARALGPGPYGRVVLALAVVGLVATFLDLTLEEAVVHHGARALAAQDHGRLRSILRIALLIDVAIGIAVFAGIMFAAGLLASAASGGFLDSDLIRLAALATLAATTEGTSGAVLLLAGRPDVRGWTMAWTGLARLLGALIAVQFGGPRAVLIGFAVAAAIGGLTQLAVSWHIGWRHWSAAGPNTEKVRVGRALVVFGFHSSLTTSITALRTALVPLVLGRTAGSVAVGLFQVGSFPVTMAGVASLPVRMALLPEQAQLAAHGDTNALKGSVRAYTKAALMIGIPAVVAGWFLLPWLLTTLYGDRFQGAVLPARILLVAGLAFLVVAWGKILPAAVGRPALRTRVMLLELILALSLTALLASRGAVGGAIASAITGVVVAIVWWMVASRVRAVDPVTLPRERS